MRIAFKITEYPHKQVGQDYFWFRIEGELSIWVGGRLYFHEESVALVEFAWCLTKWLAQVNLVGQTVPLTYFTMDHDESEGALLELIPINAQEYTLDSIWKEFNYTSALAHADVKSAVEEYLKSLDVALYVLGGTSIKALLPQ